MRRIKEQLNHLQSDYFIFLCYHQRTRLSRTEISITVSAMARRLSSTSMLNELRLSTEPLIEQFQCSICIQAMMGKILVCFNGHSICQQCFDRLNLPKSCPCCKQKFACCNAKNIRNLTMEKLIFSTELPCKYYNHGCKEHTVGNQRITHSKECRFRPFLCPFSCAILPLFDECLFSTNSIDELLLHVDSKHNFDIFENKTNEFQFQLDDITDGSGHYRIILKSIKPKIQCLLVGFKSQSGSIVLFCRSLSNRFANTRYTIKSNFVGDDGKTHSVEWKSQMYTTENEIGLEFRNGLLLKLSKEQVQLWTNNNKENSVPLIVIVGDRYA